MMGVDWTDGREIASDQRSCQMETTRRPMFRLQRGELHVAYNVHVSLHLSKIEQSDDLAITGN